MEDKQEGTLDLSFTYTMPFLGTSALNYLDKSAKDTQLWIYHIINRYME